MPKFKPQTRRQMFIDEVLRRKRTNGQPLPTYASLCREWNADAYEHEQVCDRTIRRDIEWMRDYLGMPVEYDSQRKGLRYTEENCSMPAIPIKESELFFILVADRALQQYKNTPLHNKLKDVFNRILAAIPENKVLVEPELLSHLHITFMDEPVRKMDLGIWEEVSKALYQQRQLRIMHRNAHTKKHTVREVDPYHLVATGRGRAWYLVAYCHKRRAVRMFALQRIIKAERCRGRFTIPEDFDAKSMLGNFGAFASPEAYDMEIHFDKNAAPYIQEQEWLENQTIEKAPGGAIIFRSRGETTHIDVLARWVLSWGRSARVVAPPSLVKAVKAELAATVDQYD